MKTKILKIQRCYNRTVWETKLSIHGPISDETHSGEQAYEMRVDFYEDDSSIPYKTIIIDEKHYENNISKYGMEALLLGVELISLLNITEEPGDESVDHYKREIESIAYSIVAKMEQDTFFNNYNPDNLRRHIEGKLLKLREKFKIEPK